MTFGEHIKRIREDLNMSTKEAASELSISSSYLNTIETYAPFIPSAKVIKRIADWYGEDFDELMKLAGRVEELQP